MAYFIARTGNKAGYYINSDFIKVYPCAYRGNNGTNYIDLESQLNTERNITLPTTLGKNNRSYIVETTDEKLTVIIDGYYFEITKDIDDEILSSIKYLNIYKVDKAIGNSNSGTITSSFISSFESSELLDIVFEGEYYFTGLVFSVNALTASDVIDISNVISLRIDIDNFQRFAAIDTSLIKNKEIPNNVGWINLLSDKNRTIDNTFDTLKLNAINAAMANIEVKGYGSDSKVLNITNNNITFKKSGAETIKLNNDTGNITTVGTIKTDTGFNFDDKLTATYNNTKIKVQGYDTEVNLNSSSNITIGNQEFNSIITNNQISLNDTVLIKNEGNNTGSIKINNAQNYIELKNGANVNPTITVTNSSGNETTISNEQIKLERTVIGIETSNNATLEYNKLTFANNGASIVLNDDTTPNQALTHSYIKIGDENKNTNISKCKIRLGNTDNSKGYIELDATRKNTGSKSISLVSKNNSVKLTDNNVEVKQGNEAITISHDSINNDLFTLYRDQYIENGSDAEKGVLEIKHKKSDNKTTILLEGTNKGNITVGTESDNTTISGGLIINKTTVSDHIHNPNYNTNPKFKLFVEDNDNAGKLILTKNTNDRTIITGGKIESKDIEASNTIIVNKDSITNKILIGATAGEIEAKQFYARSDRRLKENIKDYKSENSILDINVKEYNFIGNDKKEIGFIAQDLQEKFPDLVKENENGYLSIQENKLVYLLLEEVKKLKEEIKELKGE